MTTHLAPPSTFAMDGLDKDDSVCSDYEDKSLAGYDDDDDDASSVATVTSPHDKLLQDYDLEAQQPPNDISLERQMSTPLEYSVPTSKKLFFLALYFLFNLGVTLGNKAVLKSASFPWMLTFCHTAATGFGCSVLLGVGYFKLTKLCIKDNLILVVFSTLFTINIAVSNVSLSLVSVPFHQILRSSGPIVTIFLYRLLYSRTYSTATYLSLLPLILGVALATFGSYSFTPLGFSLTFLGVFLASIKSIATNRLMTGTLKLSAVEVLWRMSPLAAGQCLLYAWISGELSAIETFTGEGLFTTTLIVGIVGNAAMAFALNIVSFQTNKVAGALTISVCGNIKQCLTILLGIVLFGVRIRWVNGIGMVIAIIGAAVYSKVELDRTKAETKGSEVKSSG